MLHSLKIVKEAVVHAENVEHKLFEESIVLTKSFNFTNDSSVEGQRKILAAITSQEPQYKNEYGDLVEWKAVLIVEVCEVDFDIPPMDEYAEIFSHFIEMPPAATLQDVIHKFYPDYVWGEMI
ncbi:hypothetical protein ACWOEH_06730 [Enterococcus nangangensis]